MGPIVRRLWGLQGRGHSHSQWQCGKVGVNLYGEDRISLMNYFQNGL